MKAWLFDVDGVITNPTKKEASPELIKKLCEILERGELIGFNTGRSLEFVEKEVLKLIETILKPTLLKNIYFAGEKGGTWGRYIDGKVKEEVDESLALPEKLIQEIRELIQNKFSSTTFFDETKKTMISTEFIKDTDLKKFHEDQKRLEEEMKKILKKHRLENLRIDPTIIATDIQNPHVGKDLGVKRFLDMISGLHEPNEFETFGDSPSDLEMYKYLIKNKHSAKFIYVGNKEIEDEKNIIKTKEKFDNGTLEYLQNN